MEDITEQRQNKRDVSTPTQRYQSTPTVQTKKRHPKQNTNLLIYIYTYICIYVYLRVYTFKYLWTFMSACHDRNEFFQRSNIMKGVGLWRRNFHFYRIRMGGDYEAMGEMTKQ